MSFQKGACLKKIITFESVHYTIKADALIAPLGINYQVVTTPKYISSDCGMSVEVAEEKAEQICELLDNHKITYKVYDKQ